MIDWMLDTFWATSLLILAVLLLRRPVTDFFGATIAYSLWLIPATRLFMPVLYKEVEAAPLQQFSKETTIPLDAMQNIAVNPIFQQVFIDWAIIALVIWAGVAAAIFIIQTARYISMRDEILSNAKILDQYDNVILIESDMVQGPLAFGIFKKYIAMPLNFDAMFPSDEREMALAHEMVHHKSGDLIINLFAFIFLCLSWFSPLSWYAWNKFRIDQESACDARVLKESDKGCAHVYGRALVRSANDEAPIFATALNSPKTILTRLRMLKMPPISNKRKIFGKLSIFTMIAAALPLTATVIPVAAQEEKELKPKQVIQDVGPDTIIEPKYKIPTKGSKLDEEIRVIKVKNIDSDKSRKVIISGNQADDANTKEIDVNGKKFFVNSNNRLSDKEIEKLVGDAEKSLEKIEFKSNQKVKFPKGTKFVIRSDDDGKIKTFDIVGDSTIKKDTAILKADNNIKLKTNDRVAILSDKLAIKGNERFPANSFNVACKENTKKKSSFCDGSKRFALVKSIEVLRSLEDLQSNIRAELVKSLKTTQLSKKERKKVIKELEKTMKDLEQRLDNLREIN